MGRDAELQVILKLERKAEQIQAANPGLSFETCYGRALLQNPLLYRAYCEAREDAKRTGRRPIVGRQNRGGRG